MVDKVDKDLLDAIQNATTLEELEKNELKKACVIDHNCSI